jgi:hypothetical protein
VKKEKAKREKGSEINRIQKTSARKGEKSKKRREVRREGKRKEREKEKEKRMIPCHLFVIPR